MQVQRDKTLTSVSKLLQRTDEVDRSRLDLIGFGCERVGEGDV